MFNFLFEDELDELVEELFEVETDIGRYDLEGDDD